MVQISKLRTNPTYGNTSLDYTYNRLKLNNLELKS
jgi:hypothetical protein